MGRGRESVERDRENARQGQTVRAVLRRVREPRLGYLLVSKQVRYPPVQNEDSLSLVCARTNGYWEAERERDVATRCAFPAKHVHARTIEAREPEERWMR